MMFVFWLVRNWWSKRTFGPVYHRGPMGPTLHLGKEVRELIAAIEDSEYAKKRADLYSDDPTGEFQSWLKYQEKKRDEEIVDCLFLILDIAMRVRISYFHLLYLCFKKLRKNMRREWADWRTIDPQKPSEHVRGIHD